MRLHVAGGHQNTHNHQDISLQKCTHSLSDTTSSYWWVMQVQRRAQRQQADREHLIRLETYGIAALEGSRSLFSPVPYDESMIPANKLQNTTRATKLAQHKYTVPAREVLNAVRQLTQQVRPRSAPLGCVRTDRALNASAHIPLSSHRASTRNKASRVKRIRHNATQVYARATCGFGNSVGPGRSVANKFI